MSILIRGMKMPKTCDECLFQDKEALACKITHSISWEWADDEGCRTISPKPDDCPLIELQPHGRWIEESDYDGDSVYVCSECGETWTLIDGTPQDNNMHYCPKCGAIMDGGGDHAEEV